MAKKRTNGEATSETERMGGGRGDAPPGTIKAASGLSSTPSPISDPPQPDTTSGPWRNPPSPGSATSSWPSSPAGRFKSSTRTCWRMDGYEKNKRRNTPASAAHGTRCPRHVPWCPGPGGERTSAHPKPRKQQSYRDPAQKAKTPSG